MKQISFEIVVEREENPLCGYSVFCPSLPGCFSSGRTIEEAKQNMRHAIAQHIESLLANGEVIPVKEKSFSLLELTFVLPQ